MRRMRGGAQGHLMRASDAHYYIVKFQNNPQHPRVLANELLASRLAAGIGLPVPDSQIIEVEKWLIEKTPDLNLQMMGGVVPCLAGLQFGSRYVLDPREGQVFDYLPDETLERVRNVNEFAGIMVIDKWTCNANGRQAVFWKKRYEQKYTASFIDQGYCFNAGEWTFPDSPLRGVYGRNSVYAGVTGWKSFEPWLTRVEESDLEWVGNCAQAVAPEWYGGDWEAMEKLVETLMKRRSRVRELIRAFKESSRQPFPAWQEKTMAVRMVAGTA